MAIAPSPRNLEQDRSRIRSPLGRLRKYIHGYVTLEGMAFAAMFLALWFWIGLLLDYGFFKLTLIDWVQTLPWIVRCGLLVLVLGALLALVATKILLRLFREFSDAAMALVLERRFPEQLGDRLITAVEMADPQQAAQYGYSPALIKETIHEAAERVDGVPVGQVFDWRRLVRQGLLVVLLSVGLGAIVGGGFCAARNLNDEGNPLEGFADFAEVASIWTERNVLLRNTIWPRKAYLEILPWERTRVGEQEESGSDELRIPQASTPPMLRVRAWKYVHADARAAEGWRLLTWSDLQDNPRLALGESVPTPPEGWLPRDPNIGLTVDEVELNLDAFPIRNVGGRWELRNSAEEWRELLWADLTRERLGGLEVPPVPAGWDATAALAGAMIHGDPFGGIARAMGGPKSLTVSEVQAKLATAGNDHPRLRAVFQRLQLLTQLREVLDGVEANAANRAMRRTLRKLIVPDVVTLTYKSVRSTSTSPMTRIAGNEYTGNFAELRESVTFTVQGEDYITPVRRITVVDRPRVGEMISEEEQPAYLFYRPTTELPASQLRGVRQKLKESKQSTTGDASVMDVPAGTNVKLTVKITKPLRKEGFHLVVEKKDERFFNARPPERLDEFTYRIELPNVRREQRFTMQFEDTDGVVGERKVVIQPRSDTSPRVREFNPDEIIRRGRGNEGYIVAAGARIPFKGAVSDDHGLSRVRFVCRVIPADFLSEQKVRTLFGVGGVALFGPGSGGPFGGTAYFASLFRELTAHRGEEHPEQSIDLPAFTEELRNHRPNRDDRGEVELLESTTILSRLENYQSLNYRRLMNQFRLNPDPWINQLVADEDRDSREPGNWIKPADAPLGCDLRLDQLKWLDRDGTLKPIQDPDTTRQQKRFIVEVRLLVEDTFLDRDPQVIRDSAIWSLSGAANSNLGTGLFSAWMAAAKLADVGPNVSPSGETFTFVVVPENELLARIGEEEEAKYRDLQKAYKPLPDNLDRMRDINFALSDGDGLNEALINSFIARCETLSEVLKNSGQDTKGVYDTYSRIIREMRTNAIDVSMLRKVYQKIYLPLEDLVENRFEATLDAVTNLRRTLDNPTQPLDQRIKAGSVQAARARTELNELIKKLNEVLDAMEGLSKLNELIAALERIEEQEKDLESLVKKILEKRIKEELER